MILPSLDRGAHKYNRGLVALAVGSATYPGAAVLAVGGARRGGAGYIGHVSADATARLLVLQKYPDVVCESEPGGHVWQRAGAVVVGCGVDARDPAAKSLVQAAVRTDATLVLDGGALEVIDADGALRNAVRHRPVPTIVTPHEGEARALGWSAAPGDRLGAAVALAKELKAVVVLKGAGTIIASPVGEPVIDSIGGPELATAGTGDILAGLIGSLCAARNTSDIASAAAAACDAVRVHSTAGRIAASRVRPVTALDVLDALPAAMAECDR